ncbi:hypothetical protein [Microbacterium esteraromaticum]|uniref:hypothetical protein n=1 Tax=Microbacterium esteraromaticum TaxID=57043 RepID=UPI00117D0E22|nr:hypothetical protein [Microbacterium esteraromaticum]
MSEEHELRPVDAAHLIRQRHAEADARRVKAERARAERAAQVTSAEHEQRQYTDPHRERGIGF